MAPISEPSPDHERQFSLPVRTVKPSHDNDHESSADAQDLSQHDLSQADLLLELTDTRQQNEHLRMQNEGLRGAMDNARANEIKAWAVVEEVMAQVNVLRKEAAGHIQSHTRLCEEATNRRDEAAQSRKEAARLQDEIAAMRKELAILRSSLERSG